MVDYSLVLVAIDGRQIIHQLKEGPRGVRDLVEATDLPRDHISYYLDRLEQVGLIDRAYEILRKPTQSVKGLARQVYSINERRARETVKECDTILSDLRSMISTI